MVIVTGPPFAGKGRFVRDEVSRREADGELGLIAIDYTALYQALVWGVQSSYRDDRVGATGAPRFIGYLYSVAIREALDRQLDGFITTNSPRQALSIAERFGSSTKVIEVQAGVEELAARTRTHLDSIKLLVPRARIETPAEDGRAKPQPQADGRCTQALVAYFRELDAIAGKARGVRRKGSGKAAKFVSTGAVRQFDRGLWLRGLTTQGRAAVDALVAEGTAEPGPTAVLKYLLREKGR